MHWFRVLGVFLIVALVQATVLPALRIGRAVPDLLLLVALYLAAREPQRGRSRWQAFWLGWAAGLMAGVYSTGSDLRPGLVALVFGLLALTMSKLGEELYLGSAISQVLVFGPACLCVYAVLGVALTLATGAPADVALGNAFRTACYSALAAPLVFAMMRPLERFLGVRSRRGFERV